MIGPDYDQKDPTGILEGVSPSENYTPEEEELKLVGRLKERFNEAEDAKANWAREANYHRLWLAGNQVILRSRSTGDTLRASLRSGDSRRLSSHDNILRVTGRALVGKLSRIIPKWVVTPATNDQMDLRGAVVADAFLAYIFKKEKIRKKYIKANRTLLWSGTSIWQVAWDPNKGRSLSWCGECDYTGEKDLAGQPCPACEFQYQTEAQAQNDQEQARFEQEAAIAQASPYDMPPPSPPALAEPRPAPQMKLVKEGDICIVLHDPRDFFPEPGIADIEDMRWVCVRKPYPVSELRERFPDKGEFIHEEDGIYSDRSANLSGGLETYSEVQYLEGHAYLYEFHEQPTAMHPDGRIIYMVNDMVVATTAALAPEYERLPFFVWHFERNDGDFWGESFIAQAWHVQKERNKLLSQMRTQRDLTNQPQKLVPITSRISLSEWDDQPGRHLVFNPMGGKPQYLEQPEFPTYTYNELERMRIAIQDKASVNDHDLGRTTTDTSGRYAALLEAQSSEAVAPIIIENEDEFMEMGKLALAVAQERYSDDRVWAIQGHDRVLSYAWSEMTLSPGWDLDVDKEDSLSTNPVLRLQQSRELLRDGVFTDPMTGIVDMRAFKRVAGLRTPGAGPDLRESERAYAADVPKMLERGEGFQPYPWDDVEVMAEELLGWLRGPGRKADPRLRDQVGQIWIAYAQMMQPGMTSMTPANVPMLNQQQQQQQQQPGGMGPGAMASANAPQQEAQGIVQGADEAAENMASIQDNHEG